MAVRLTYIAIAFGGVCGAIAALVGSPSAPTETSPPLGGMNDLPMRPIGQLATSSSATRSATATPQSTLPSSPSASSVPSPLASASSAPSANTPSESVTAGASSAAPTPATPPSWDTDAPPNDKDTLLHTEMRCDQKDAPSCILAARAYEGGSAGITDAEKAAKYRKIALTLWISQCDHNSATACAILTEMYRTGHGVPQNDKTAAALVVRTRELCRYNDAPACHTLPAQ